MKIGLNSRLKDIENSLGKCLRVALEGNSELDAITDIVSLISNEMGNVDITVVFYALNRRFEIICTTLMNDDVISSVFQSFLKVISDCSINYPEIKDFDIASKMKKRKLVENIDVMVLGNKEQLYGFCIIEYHGDKKDILNDNLQYCYDLLSLLVRNYSLNRKSKVEIYMDHQTLLFGRDNLIVFLKKKKNSKQNKWTIGILKIKNIKNLYYKQQYKDILLFIKNNLAEFSDRLYRIANDEIAFVIEDDYIEASVMLKELLLTIAKEYDFVECSAAYADGKDDCLETYRNCELAIDSLESGELRYISKELDNKQVDILNGVIEEKKEEIKPVGAAEVIEEAEKTIEVNKVQSEKTEHKSKKKKQKKTEEEYEFDFTLNEDFSDDGFESFF